MDTLVQAPVRIKRAGRPRSGSAAVGDTQRDSTAKSQSGLTRRRSLSAADFQQAVQRDDAYSYPPSLRQAESDLPQPSEPYHSSSWTDTRNLYHSTVRATQRAMPSWSGMTGWLNPRESQHPEHSEPMLRSHSDMFRDVPLTPEPTMARVTRLGSTDTERTPLQVQTQDVQVPDIVVIDSPTSARPPASPFRQSAPARNTEVPDLPAQAESAARTSLATADVHAPPPIIPAETPTAFPDASDARESVWNFHRRTRSGRSERGDGTPRSQFIGSRFFGRAHDSTNGSPSPEKIEDGAARNRTHMSPSSWFSSDDEHKRPDLVHSSEMTDYLDVLDPTVGAFNTLQNMGNSFMIPHLPWLYNRRPAIRIDSSTAKEEAELAAALPHESSTPGTDNDNSKASLHASVVDEPYTRIPGSPCDTSAELADDGEVHTSRWREMDPEERAELESHIAHLLSNKSRGKRILSGFLKFILTPSGFLITFYGLAVTTWGLLIVLLIIGWVKIGDDHRNRYFIEICDQVLCALFTTIGLGMAPFRAVDTYRMIYIARFHFLTYKRRKLLGLPPLRNPNELPRYTETGVSSSRHGSDDSNATKYTDIGPELGNLSPEESPESSIRARLAALGVRNVYGTDQKDPTHGIENFFGPVPGQPGVEMLSPHERHRQRLERAPSIQSVVHKEAREISVLTPLEQSTLQHHQRMFHESHTFYRYVETETHWPFPLRLMMTIVILLDCHSFLQAALGGITWGIYYLNRPTALTATIITCSLSCSATGGILIWQGGRRTRKTDVVQRRVKLALEEEAIARMERKRKQGAETDK